MRHLVLVAISVSLGCTSSSQPAGLDLAAPLLADLSSTSSDMTNGYPAGPYGHNVGDTIAPLIWEGYSDPSADALATMKPYGSYTMNDLFQSGRPYAAIHTSAFT